MCPCSAPFATGLNCALQVVYWDALQKAQEGELSSQTEVFGGEHGQHRLKDFKCVPAFQQQLRSMYSFPTCFTPAVASYTCSGSCLLQQHRDVLHRP